VDAVRDIDDALCMIFLFASLPSNSRIPPSLVENCARLAAEWQLYVMHTRALRKIFLSIKGIYYQAEVFDQTVTWLVPYQFTQNVRTLLFGCIKRTLILCYRFRPTSMSA
jgi:pescadillo protein